MSKEEFNAYIRQSGRKLYGFAFRILGNGTEAEDAVQETYIRLWKMNNKLSTYNSIDALATTVIKNYCIDQVRKRKEVSSLDVNSDQALTSSPHEILEKAESDIAIMKIIGRMPDNYRDILQKHDLEESSYEEIANETGQNINTLRVTLSRARSMLRDEYKKYFNEKGRTGDTAGKIL